MVSNKIINHSEALQSLYVCYFFIFISESCVHCPPARKCVVVSRGIIAIMDYYFACNDCCVKDIKLLHLKSQFLKNERIGLESALLSYKMNTIEQKRTRK